MPIEVRHLTKHYGELKVFEDFCIAFEEGKITALLGPSGCGKTTLLNIISGLESYNAGSISGLDSKSFSYIFQEDRLMPWSTVEQNIRFVLRGRYTDTEIGKITEQYLKMVGLEQYGHYYPRQLSGGMKQRAAIARAFAYPGDILLMDEPFKGLDEELKTGLVQSFISLWQKDKRTAIMVTHDREEAQRIADDIYILAGKPLGIEEKIVGNGKKC